MASTTTTTTTTSLTSTTAPGKVFDNRSQLAEHYKSDWHKYNLKRREAGLPLLKETDFQARLEAALALRREREQRQERSGTDHLKNTSDFKKNKKNKNKNKKKIDKEDGRTLGTATKNNNNNNNNKNKNNKEGMVAKSQAQAYDDMKQPTTTTTPVQRRQDEEQDQVMEENDQQQEQEEPPTIEPRQCLFDKHVSSSVEDNIDYMHQHYGFFVPDREYLIDPEGLIGYCHEKMKLGQMCLYCQKTFRSWQSCQTHMVHKRHTKLLYERGQDLEEFDPFYDFTPADEDFLQSAKLLRKKKLNKHKEEDDPMDEGSNDNDNDDEGEWEDVSDDDDMEEENDEDDDEDGIYAGYEEEVAKYGFDVTPLGELIFPDGRIVGHRGLARYYRQRPTHHTDRAAVKAARRAAGERLWKGRVYDTAAGAAEEVHETSLALARAGIAPGTATGRAGKGILVASGSGGFTALSLYRYKAVVKKARREEFQGQRLQHRTRLNMNKMDKKANRLHNNVSVAHAKR